MAADGDGGLTAKSTARATARATSDPDAVLEALRRIERALSARLVFLGLLGLVLATKWPVLHQPPVWDGAMSVFPAAITLAHLDFDIVRLLEAPGYMFGGPNIHGMSLVTWGTAAAYWLLGDRPEIVVPLLHLVHFALAAWTLTSLWRIAVALMPKEEFRDLRKVWALGATLCFAACPLFFVQAGYMYLELPMLAFTAAAIAAWIEGRTARASLWALASALVKPPGMIVAGALAACAAVTDGTWTHRLRRVAALVIGPVVFAFVYLSQLPDYTAAFGSIRAQLSFASAVPDVIVLLAVFFGLTLVVRPWRPAVALVRRKRHEEPGDGEPAGDELRRARAALASLALWLSFAAFYLALIPLGKSVNVLPRYFLLVLPFALFGIVAMVAARSRRGAAVLLTLLTLFFVANRRGHFYPRSGDNQFAVAERSMAYVELMELQDLGLRKLVELGASEPVFYGLYDHYRLSYPQMGLGFEKPEFGHCVFFEWPYREGHIETFPRRFHMLFDAPWLGGEVMMRVAWVGQARADRSVTTTELQVGRFTSQIIHVAPASDSRAPDSRVDDALIDSGPVASDPVDLAGLGSR